MIRPGRPSVRLTGRELDEGLLTAALWRLCALALHGCAGLVVGMVAGLVMTWAGG